MNEHPDDEHRPMTIIIVGCGQVGYRAASLLRAIGESVLILTSEVRPDWRRNLEEAGAEVRIGDATDSEVLCGAGVKGARAVLACTSNDSVNIRVALEVKRLAPTVRVVARLFDQNLAERLDAGIGIERALAMSSVAAPSFASAASGNHVVGEFHLEGKPYMLVRHTVREDSFVHGLSPKEIKERFEADILLRVDPEGRANVDVQHHEPLAAGEIIKLIGTPRDLVTIVPAIEIPKPARRSHPSPFKVIWRTIPKSLKILSASLIALSLLSIAIFHFGMDLSPVDALYFVMATLTTTGYGDISAKDSQTWIKLYTCLLMLLGSASVAMLYSIITDLIVTARFRELVGEKPVPEQDHVIVVGIGNVGYRVVEELRENGLEVVVVDLNPETPFVSTIKARMAFIAGDGREPETLHRANLSTARSIVVTTGDDSVNLSVGLLAKQLAPNVRTVLRIFDAGFATAVQDVLEVDQALSASRLAAPEFVAAGLYPHAIAAFVMRGHLVVLSSEGDSGRTVVVDQKSIHVETRKLVAPEVFNLA